MNAKRRRIPDRFFRTLLRLFPFDFRARSRPRDGAGVSRAAGATHGGPGSARTTLARNRSGRSGDRASATRARCFARTSAMPSGFSGAPLDSRLRRSLTLAIGIERGDERIHRSSTRSCSGRCRSSAQPSWCRSRRSTAMLEMPHALSFPDLQDYRRGQTAVADLAGFEPAMVWVERR